MSPTSTHLVLSATPFWSHIRALCVFAARIAAERDIIVTILVAHWFTTFEKVNSEVSRALADHATRKGEIRVIGLGPHSFDPADACRADVPSFLPTISAISKAKPLECSATGQRYRAAPRPRLVIIDSFQYAWVEPLRVYLPKVPVLAWNIGFSGSLLQACLPSAEGGVGDILRSFGTAELESGRPIDFTGEVMAVRNLPPMYDHENFPQEFPHTGTLQGLEGHYAKCLSEVDGIITGGTPGYDGQGMLSYVESWANRPTFHVGPMLPLQPGTSNFSESALQAELEACPDGVGAEVSAFLDKALEKCGPSSVFYICFGSFFWPANSDHLWLLLDVLARRRIPFILAHGSLMASVPEEVENRFRNSDVGLLVSWAPQQTILAHEAVGWFITHGGAGGTMEALMQGVPMIGWPFLGDQPVNINHLVHTLDVAFEFIEVRTGVLGLKHLFWTGKTPQGTLEAFREEVEHVLTEATGAAGARKRRNAQRTRETLKRAWAPAGPARKAFDALLDKYCPRDDSLVRARL